MVLGGASAAKPSFKGDLAAVRLHDQAMSEEQIAAQLPRRRDARHGDAQLVAAPSPTSGGSRNRRISVTALTRRRCRSGLHSSSRNSTSAFRECSTLAELIYHTYSERLA